MGKFLTKIAPNYIHQYYQFLKSLHKQSLIQSVYYCVSWSTLLLPHRQSKMNCNYVNLLRATCNCNGEGVDGNQGLVADLFMTESKDLTIQFEYDFVERKQCDWKSFEVYGADSSTLGFNIKDKGVPMIKVRWSEIFKDFKTMQLTL